MDSLAEIVTQYAESAKYDYTGLYQVTASASRANDIDPGLTSMERTLVLLGMLLDRGFQAVDLLPDGGCRPWPDQDRAGILRAVEREWRALGDEGWVGMGFWFHLPREKMPDLATNAAQLAAWAGEEPLWSFTVIVSADTARDADPVQSRMQRTLVLVSMLLDRGVQVADLLLDGGCRPWPDQDHASVLFRLRREWEAAGDALDPLRAYCFTGPEALRPTPPPAA